MKRFLCLLLAALVLITAASASAESIRFAANVHVEPVFTSYTGMNGTARYSGVVKTDRNTMKAVYFAGYSSNGVQIAALPGTAALQCAPTSSGPWVTAKDRAANAISTTSPTVYHLDDYCQFMRVSWTKSETGARNLSSWILYGE